MSQSFRFYCSAKNRGRKNTDVQGRQQNQLWLSWFRGWKPVSALIFFHLACQHGWWTHITPGTLFCPIVRESWLVLSLLWPTELCVTSSMAASLQALKSLTKDVMWLWKQLPLGIAEARGFNGIKQGIEHFCKNNQNIQNYSCEC